MSFSAFKILKEGLTGNRGWSPHWRDPIVKKEALKRHIQSVKNHIRDLASQNYQNLPGIESLDSVIMFSPNEQAIFGLSRKQERVIIRDYRRAI